MFVQNLFMQSLKNTLGCQICCKYSFITRFALVFSKQAFDENYASFVSVDDPQVLRSSSVFDVTSGKRETHRGPLLLPIQLKFL